jgi:TonB family protein
MKTVARFRWLVLVAGLAGCGLVWGQQMPAVAATAVPDDPMVMSAQGWMRQALILRGFYGGVELVYDARGHLQGGPPKVVDWTLAGMNIETVSRNEAGMLVLEGPRVAIRYNPDEREFQRHPQKDERLRVIFPATDAAGVQAAMEAVFAVGIDPGVERSSPTYWEHYFLPATEWTGADAVGPVVSVPGAAAPPGVAMPVLETKAEPEFTGEAQRDKVKGTVQVRVAVGVDGIPRQITIRRPLGYGLDGTAAAAVAKFRFRPGTKDGKPVAVEMLINLPF